MGAGARWERNFVLPVPTRCLDVAARVLSVTPQQAFTEELFRFVASFR